MKKILAIVLMLAMCLSFMSADILGDWTDEKIENAFKVHVETFFLNCIDGNVLEAIQTLDLNEFVYNDEDIGSEFSDEMSDDDFIDLCVGISNYIGDKFIDAGFSSGYSFYEFRLSKKTDDYLRFYASDYSGNDCKIIITIKDEKFFIQEISFK